MSDTGTEKTGFLLARIIERWYERDELGNIIVYGDYGKGKSAYAIKVAAQLLGDFEAVKDAIVFHPKEFLDKITSITKREKVIIWDDAGLWLHALDYHDPFVKATTKYFNVARTDLAAIIFTAPSPKMIVKKAYAAPTTMVAEVKADPVSARGGVKVLKDGTVKDYKYRIARIYRRKDAPDMQKWRIYWVGDDRFSALLPDDFFAWYKPYRDKYAMIAKRLIHESIEKASMKETKSSKLLAEVEEYIEEAGVDV